MKAIPFVLLGLFLFNSIGYTQTPDEPLINKTRVVKYYTDTINSDTLYYPDNANPLWLEFNKDSVFIHSYCPETGADYSIFGDDSISVGPIAMHSECEVADYIGVWSYYMSCDLSLAHAIKITEDTMHIYSQNRKFLFLDEDVLAVDKVRGAAETASSITSYVVGESEIKLVYEIADNIKNATVRIINVLGECVYIRDIPVQGEECLLPNRCFDPGIYMLELNLDGTATDVVKIIL